jgi:lysophospholipase L1-like esterase
MRSLIPLLLLFALLTSFACSDAESADPPPLAGSNSGAYIALGDSLSDGVGASAPETTFVALVHQHLGADSELLNLGHSGDTSSDLIDHGHLDEAVDAITTRAADDNDANDVRLITLEIGGNDLLAIYFSLVQTGVCPDRETALNKPECTDALRSALDSFRPNFDDALARLRDAAPDATLVVTTLYNPFDFLGALGTLGELSLSGEPGTQFEEGMNDIILDVAASHDNVLVADVFTAFQGRTAGLLSSDFIHPNDAGYRAMADAIIAQLDQ